MSSPQPQPQSPSDGRSGSGSRTTRSVTRAASTSTSPPIAGSSSGEGVPNTDPQRSPSTRTAPHPFGNPNLGTLAKKSLKRPQHLVCNGRVETWSTAMEEYNCPLCLKVLTEPVITRCGHTFCQSCVRSSLAIKPVCPHCGTAEHPDHLIPNNAANQMIARMVVGKAMKTEISESAKSINVSPSQVLRDLHSNDLNLNNIENLILLLQRRKEVLTAESRVQDKTLLLEFLDQLLKVKKAEKARLDKEVHLIEQDLAEVEARPMPTTPTSSSIEMEGQQQSSETESADEAMAMSLSSSYSIEGFNTQTLASVDMLDNSMAARKRRVHAHFEELVPIYMDLRKAELYDIKNKDATVPNDGGDMDYEDLENFGHTLSRISRYSKLKPLATLTYSADMLGNNNIVSSIAFDKDNEFFAIAGVTKKIKLFEYASVIGSTVDIHCPQSELHCNAKISCVAWSSYYKNHLASSDYDGCVAIWDVAQAQRIKVLNEHEKRVWSVDWSNGDPRLVASGSDDGKVKLWATGNQERSFLTIEAKANVCCVKFCPQNVYHIAVGCADHCVHYYDFRHPKQPLQILAGHKKAVSYVKFASSHELVSASTDSTLKLWDLETSSGECVRSFTGHLNEKNFVGLATDGNYIACGSESNALYIYYRYLTRPLFHFKFDNHRNILEKPKNDDAGEFVSAVVWKKGSPVVVAANSQGSIKILELT